MFEYGDGDDFDITPTETSKLASLFSSSYHDIPSSRNLTYTSPKQPNDLNTDQSEEDNALDLNKQQITEVLMVKVVSLWKLENKNYKALGRHGLGLIGSADSKLQEVIAYKTKQLILLRAKITEKFLFFVQKDNFSSFYDNNSQNWLVKFESDDQNEFIEKIQSFGAKIMDSTKETVKLFTVKSEHPSDNLSHVPEKLGTGDQESDGAERKENILNRITKLGKQIIPKPLLTGSDVSDTEREVAKVKKHRKLKKPLKPQHEDFQQMNLNGQILIPPINSIPSLSTMQFPMLYAPTDVNSYLVTQNNELKVTLSTISSKLDALNIPKVCNDNGALNSKVKALEIKIENLEKSLETYKKRYTEVEPKYKELLEKEKNIEEKNTVVDKLESEIAGLRLALGAKSDEVELLKNHLEGYERTRMCLRDYEMIIQNQKDQIADLERSYDENKNVDNDDTVCSLNLLVEDLNQKLKIYEDKFTKSELEREHLQQKHNTKLKTIGDLIKVYMNEMYQTILTNYNEEYSYTYEEIKSALAENLKSATYSLIEELSDRIFSDAVEE